ncbi:MAG: DUF4168 domain-containing protein [Alphaproteobacteria bacterium]
MTAVAAAALALGFAAPAAAQTQQGAPSAAPPAAMAPQVDVSDEQLRTFIEAATEVQSISEKWQARAAATESTQEVEEVRRQATDEMVEAVEDKGMTVDEFNAISQAAQEDPQLHARIVAMLEQQR